MKKALFNWSGGKDSSLCLYRLLQEEQYEIYALLTSFNKERDRVSMHGVRRTLIECQACRIGIPLHKLMLPEHMNMSGYDKYMLAKLQMFQEQGIAYALFGDIFLEDLRLYREKQLRRINMKGVFPLWKKSTAMLAREFIDVGFKAIITSVDGSKLDVSFVGRAYDREFLKDLPPNVDSCGEYGAFHTFVYDGPIFDTPVPFKKGEIVERNYDSAGDANDKNSGHSFTQNSPSRSDVPYWFIDLLPVKS